MRFGSFGLAGTVLLLLVAGGCSSSGSAPAPERVGAARGAIQGGTTDTTHTFAVGVHGQDQFGDVGLCSGALITPNLVMTARHCVDQTPMSIDCSMNPTFLGTMFDASQLHVTTTSSNVNVGTTGWHSVAKIDVPSDNHICGNDIALLTLNGTIASTEAKPIIPGVQYPMDDIAIGYSFDYTAIGFGATDGSGQTGQGTRRIRSGITLTCIPNSDTTYDCPTMDAMGNPVNINPREFLGGDGTCEGDSGSSAYDQKLFDMGIFLSHGILSRGAADPTNCVGSLYTRVDAWRDLIVNTATTASQNWTLYPKPNPDWTIYVPPPATADGGSDSGSKPTTKPSGKGIGEACTMDGDCASKLCKDPGDGNTVCTQDCSMDATSCPDGYTCTSDTQLCFAASSSQPQSATTTTTSGGCSVTRDPTKPIPWRGLGFGAALALTAVLRRRKRW